MHVIKKDSVLVVVCVSSFENHHSLTHQLSLPIPLPFKHQKIL